MLPAVHDAVAHGLDLGAVLDDADPVRAEEGQRPLDGQLVLEDLGRLAHLRLALRLAAKDDRATDVLDETFREGPVRACRGRVLVRLDQLELHR